MKKSMSKNLVAATVAVVVLSFASDVFSLEFFPAPQGYSSDSKQANNGSKKDKREKRVKEDKTNKGGSYSSVPELDASGAPIALALVGGIAGVALERRRRKKKQ